MSSAICFNLDQTRILSSDSGLNNRGIGISQTHLVLFINFLAVLNFKVPKLMQLTLHQTSHWLNPLLDNTSF